MKVSFVIPTRNQAGFIRRCIASCLEQGLPDAEILVIDGQSTDGTQDILASYGESIRWTSERDSGQAEAVNKGIARASGEIIAWINSDDMYAGKDVLRTVVAAFQEDPVIDVVFGDALVVDAGGKPIRPFRNRPFKRPNDLLISPHGPSQPATFFRRDIFLAIGGLRQDLHYALDYDLFLRMFAAARAKRYLPQPLAYMTFHPSAKSIRGLLQQVQELTHLKYDRLAHAHLGVVDHIRLRLGIAELFVYWALVELGIRRAV